MEDTLSDDVMKIDHAYQLLKLSEMIGKCSGRCVVCMRFVNELSQTTWAEAGYRSIFRILLISLTEIPCICVISKDMT
jgi:hypothetical protein